MRRSTTAVTRPSKPALAISKGFTVGEASNWNNAPLDKYPRDFLRIGLDAGFMREDVTSSSRDDSDRNIGPLRPCCNLSDRAIASDCNDSIE
jgi:hypothetical protein